MMVLKKKMIDNPLVDQATKYLQKRISAQEAYTLWTFLVLDIVWEIARQIKWKFLFVLICCCCWGGRRSAGIFWGGRGKENSKIEKRKYIKPPPLIHNSVFFLLPTDSVSPPLNIIWFFLKNYTTPRTLRKKKWKMEIYSYVYPT